MMSKYFKKQVETLEEYIESEEFCRAETLEEFLEDIDETAENEALFFAIEMTRNYY